MRIELHNRDGKRLGVMDLEVPPAEFAQDLIHTCVVMGSTVAEVLAPLPGDDGPVVAVAAPAKSAKRRQKRGDA